jgi:hypothetical protein
MARKAQLFSVTLKVEYVPIPADRVGAWRASLLLLLDLLYEEREFYKAEIANEHKRSDRDRNSNGVRPALFPVEDVARQRAAKTGCLHAWFVGHDGSAQLVAYGSR